MENNINAETGSITETMAVRKMPFEFSDDINPHWNKDKPEWSHMVNGASLVMPYLEPYMIRTLKKAYSKIDSDKLKADVKLFIGQEAQHYQQHRKFNDMLINNGYSELEKIEEQMKGEYGAFEKERSFKFNLAYACGFESMSLGVAHWLINNREYLFSNSDTKVASLILWHFVEEIEHKNVAFDAYQAIFGNYFYRVFATVFSTLHVIKFSRKAYVAMLKKDGLWGSLASRWRLQRMLFRFLITMLPTTVSACLPWHHPSNIKDPQWSVDWISSYNDSEFSTLDTDNLETFPTR